MNSMLTKIKLAGAIVALLVVIVLSTKVFTVLDAGEYMVIQYPTGAVNVAVEPGIYGEWFGTVTRYKRREQYSFSVTGNDNASIDKSLRIQFNDGGSGKISGVVSWEMPDNSAQILEIHKQFRSQSGVDAQLIRPVIENAIFMSGPLMSSTESAGERRAELLQLISDQAQNGIYKTERVKKKVMDLDGQEKEVTASQIMVRDSHPVRETESPLKKLGIAMMPATINAIIYDSRVQSQIDKRQEQITEVQTAIAQAKKAEQQAITVAKQGEASAAEAKWKQEVIKAELVTKAEADKAVAELSVKTAELNKRSSELQGEGEAAKRRAIMNADGGLEKKLEAYVRVQEIWATAFKEHNGSIVPSVVMGNGGGASGNAVGNANALVDLLTVKTAKDLTLDLGINRGNGGGNPPASKK